MRTSAVDEKELLALARTASFAAYAPYSRFHVGAALYFSDGSTVTGSNVENASYGLALCAETVAVGIAMNQGVRGGLEAVAIAGGLRDADGLVCATELPVTPCGRCRQTIMELAALGATDPIILCDGTTGAERYRLSELLPAAFGPNSLE